MLAQSLPFFFFFFLFLLLVLPAVGEAGVAKAGTDGEHAPALDVLHERHLAQALRHAVIVHQRRGVMTADLGNSLDQERRQIEFAALPIARQVLGAFFDSAVFLDHAGTGDPDERRQLQPLGFGGGNQVLQHLDQSLDRAFPARLVVGVAPQIRFPHRRFRQVRCLFPAGLDHAAADVGAADIHRQDAVVGLENP